MLDVVEDPAADEFPGVFCGRLRSRCWTADSSGIYFNTLWRSSIAGVKVDVATGAVAPVPFIDPRTGATCTAAPGTGPCSTGVLRGFCMQFILEDAIGIFGIFNMCVSLCFGVY